MWPTHLIKNQLNIFSSVTLLKGNVHMADANKGIEMEMPKERMIMIGTCSACSVHLILA